MKNFGEYAPESAMDFIEAWEGCRLQAYKCPHLDNRRRSREGRDGA